MKSRLQVLSMCYAFEKYLFFNRDTHETTTILFKLLLMLLKLKGRETTLFRIHRFKHGHNWLVQKYILAIICSGILTIHKPLKKTANAFFVLPF